MERLLLPKSCFLANRRADSAAETRAGQQTGSHSLPPLIKAALINVMLVTLLKVTKPPVCDLDVRAVMLTSTLAKPITGLCMTTGRAVT